MRDETVARNYAETLLDVAERHEGLEAFGDGVEFVARLIDESPSFRVFLETPQIAASEKKEVVRAVFARALPAMLINFLLVTIDKRRQRLLRAIAEEYQTLVDERLGRMRVEVTLARPIGDRELAEVQQQLSILLDREAIPQVRVKPGILGGVVVRTGDTIYDGSLRRRLDGMRRSLLASDLPPLGEA